MLKFSKPEHMKNIQKAIDDGILDDNPYLPIFRLVSRGLAAHLAAIQTPPGEKKERWEIVGRKPHLITIGDDMPVPPDSATSLGPSAFHRKSLLRSIERCHGTVLQSASFRPDVMEEIAARLLAGQNILLVECADWREIEWRDFLTKHKAQNLLIVTAEISRYSSH